MESNKPTLAISCPGHGSLQSRIALIGEAPGEQEQRIGVPFVGRAGKELTIIMDSIGLARSACYITNVVKSRPANNNIDLFINFPSTGGLPYETNQFLAYKQHLYEELDQCEANVLVALGRVPLWALTRRLGITKWRGSILPAVPELQGRKVVAAIHPSAALRLYMYRHYIKHDLQRAYEESLTPDINYPEREILVAPSFDESMQWLSMIQESYSEVAYDIETISNPKSGYEVSCISFAVDQGRRSISIPFYDGSTNYFPPDQEMEVWREIDKVLGDPRIKKLGQNLEFDATFLFRRMGIITENMDDTMVAQAILYPDFPRGLDFITSIYTKEPYYKDEGKQYKSIRDPKSFWTYNAKDSAVCSEAFPRMKQELSILGNWETYEQQVRLIPALTYMQTLGMRVDVQGMKRAADEAKEELAGLGEELNEIAGRYLNYRSPKELREYFFDEKRLKPTKFTPAGVPSTDVDVLKQLAVHGHEEARILLRIRHIDKLQSTYYEMEFDKDDRIRTSFNPVGTKFGRLSSRKTLFGTGGNMQNIPYGVRRYILPDDGFVLYNVDLSQAEDRVVAHIAPEPTKLKAYRERQDIHRLTSSIIFGKPPEDISDEEGSCALGDGEHSERDWGKRANHAFNYGLGWRKFSTKYEIDAKNAKRIRSAYYELYPGLNQYYEWVKAELSMGRLLTTPFGRKIRFLDRWNDDLLRAAYSCIPQSTVGEMINRWGILEIWENPGTYHGVMLMNQVHDSIVFQVPDNWGWDNHAKILEALTASLSRPLNWRGVEFSIPADVSMGKNWGQLSKIKGLMAENLEATWASLSDR